MFALLCLAASAFAAAAEPKSEMELAQHLKSQIKCGSEKNPLCSLKFRGLEIEFSDMKNPSGGAMAVIELGSAQKYSNFGNQCIMIEFMDKDILFHSAATKGTGIVFRADGAILPQSKTREAEALCQ